MSESEKSKTSNDESAKVKKEELFDMVISALKRNHNWKFLVGFALGWLAVVYVF